ncbi:MAG: hypothetical protein ACRC2S_10555 [Waterburya sp.]
MGRPFSDLEQQALRLIAGGGDPLTGNDEVLKKYWKWRINPGDPSHDLPAASSRTIDRQTNEIGISPFGLDLAAGQVAKTTISIRSAAFYNAYKAELGLKELSATVIGIPLDFRPAKIYARKGAAATSREETSRITGRKYRTRFQPSDEGFTSPFGTKASGDDIAERQAVLKPLVGGASGVGVVTFTPERFKS